MSEEPDQVLELSVGRCLMAWARMEFEMARLFHALLTETSLAKADAILAAVRGFENKLKVVGAAFDHSITDEQMREDWSLLANYAVTQSHLRNQIAHAGVMIIEGKGRVLKPYLSYSSTSDPIEQAEVETRTTAFRALREAFTWMKFCAIFHLGLTTVAPPPAPDRIQTFRDEAARRRAGKRRQQKPSRT